MKSRMFSTAVVCLAMTMALTACGGTPINDTPSETEIQDAVVLSDSNGVNTEVTFYDGTTVKQDDAGLSGQVVLLDSKSMLDTSTVEIEYNGHTLLFDPAKTVRQIHDSGDVSLNNYTGSDEVGGGAFAILLASFDDDKAFEKSFECGVGNPADDTAAAANVFDLHLDYINLKPLDGMTIQGVTYTESTTLQDFVSAWGEPVAAHAKWSGDAAECIYAWAFNGGWIVWNTCEANEYNRVFVFRADTFLTEYITGLDSIIDTLQSVDSDAAQTDASSSEG